MNTQASELAQQWLDAKKAEAAANAARIAIEEQLIALLGQKSEGSQTHTVSDLFKVEITSKLTRKLDFVAWASVKDKFPANMHPIKIKEELDERGVKYLEANEPELYRLLPLTVTPAKTAVKVTIHNI